MTAPELYIHIKKILENNNIEAPQFEAMCIIESIFRKKLNRILIDRQQAFPEQINFADNIAYKRIKGEPLQYLLGEWEFYGMPFCVGKGVLIPRQDTETLVEAVIEAAKKINSPRMIDLCSGSGCIACAAAKNIESAKVYALEKHEKAIGYLNKNIALNNVNVTVIEADVLSEKTEVSDFDIIVCNPPYLSADDMKSLQREVAFEPEEALFGGNDGLYFYREITRIWQSRLKPGGIMAYEIGIGQENDVRKIMSGYNFKNIEFIKDLPGIIRVVKGEKTC